MIVTALTESVATALFTVATSTLLLVLAARLLE